MDKLVRSFFKGLLILVPLVGTVYIVYLVVSFVDDFIRVYLDELIGVRIPGLGILVTLVLITLVGVLASHTIGKKAIEALERGFTHVPVVKLLYSSIKDLMGAFVGDKKSFDQPVMVDLIPERGVKVLGFVTCTHFDDPQLYGHVAVYLPQSYNFAGNLLVVPRERVHPVDAEGAQFLAFIVSGGVAEMNAASTVMDGDFAIRR